MVNEVTNTKLQLVMPPKAPATGGASGKGPSVDVVNGNINNSVVGSGKAGQAELLDAVNKMQDYAQMVSRNLDFSVDEESGETVIKVIDPETDEVVRQIPSEEVLRIVRALESGGGFLMEAEA